MFLTLAAAYAAGPVTIEVRHRHLRKGAPGTLTFSGDALRFVEQGKHAGHSRTWKYSDLQRFDLAPDRIRIRTYEDVRWQVGRDREYLFDELPKDAAVRLYPFLAAKLDQRFIAEVPSPAPAPLWQAPAKMLHRTGGWNGVLSIAQDRVVFESATPGRGSRTWRTADIENFSREGTFELTLTSLDGETRFQLKQALPEDRYDELWRHFNRVTGLNNSESLKEHHHD